MPAYLAAPEEEILGYLKSKLGSAIQEAYGKFLRLMLSGMMLLIVGLVLYMLGVDYAAGLMVLFGLVLLAYAFFGVNVVVKRLGVVLYPVGLVPYGDKSNALLVDLRGRGEKIRVSIPRLDKVRSSIENVLTGIEELVHKEGIHLPEESMVIIESGDIALLASKSEVELHKLLEQLGKLLENVPRDEYELSLWKPSTKETSVYPLSILVSRVNLEDLKKLDQSAALISAYLRSLETSYEDLLSRIDRATRDARQAIQTYYNMLSESIDLVHDYTRIASLLLHIPICPVCFARMSKAGLLQALLEPPILRPRIESGMIVYHCPHCGKTYAMPLDPGVTPNYIPMYRFDILFNKVWAYLYVKRLDEINRYVSNARREKDQIWSSIEQEASKAISNVAAQYSGVYTSIEEHMAFAEMSARLLEMVEGSIKCDTDKVIEAAKIVDMVEEKIAKMMRGETIVKMLKEYEDKRRLKIDSIYMNEDILETILRVYQAIGDTNMAERIRKLLDSRDVEEFLKLIHKG